MMEIANLKWNVRAQNWRETYWPVWEISIKAQVGGRKEDDDFVLHDFIHQNQMDGRAYITLFIFNKCLNVWLSANVLV